MGSMDGIGIYKNHGYHGEIKAKLSLCDVKGIGHTHRGCIVQ